MEPWIKEYYDAEIAGLTQKTISKYDQSYLLVSSGLFSWFKRVTVCC